MCVNEIKFHVFIMRIKHSKSVASTKRNFLLSLCSTVALFISKCSSTFTLTFLIIILNVVFLLCQPFVEKMSVLNMILIIFYLPPRKFDIQTNWLPVLYACAGETFFHHHLLLGW